MSLQKAAAKCPFCQTEQAPRFVLDKVNENGSFSLYHCQNCGGEYFAPFFHPGGDWYEKGDPYNVKESFSPRDLHCYHKYFLSNQIELEGKAVLEFGCGTGEFLAELAKHGADVYGVDIDNSAIAIARSAFSLNNLFPMSIGDFVKNPPRAEFDYLTMFEVFEHVDNPIDILQSAHRLLKNGGKIFISIPSRDRIFLNFSGWDFPYHHLSRWDGQSFTTILKLNGFSDVKVSYINRYNQLRELFLEILADKFHFKSARKFKQDDGSNKVSIKPSLKQKTKQTILRLVYPLARFIGVKMLPNILAVIFYPVLLVFYPKSGVMFFEARK
ncbi:MAG TPA: class I SAM-dependent methyltransferase [bacterium]|nr:class I SAM-dependent methyltransferase [bacterium]